MVELDHDFCFPCSLCLAKFDSLRQLRNHVCGLLQNVTKEIKNVNPLTKSLVKTENYNKEHNSKDLSLQLKSNVEEKCLSTYNIVLDHTNQNEQDRLPSMLQPENREPFPELDRNNLSKPKEDLISKDYVSECAPCKKVFFNKIIYLRHQWAHKKSKGNTGTLFTCTEHDCPDIFWKSENLNYHKGKTHGIKQIFTCDVCPFSSKYKKVVKQHHDNKHLNLNLNSFRCTECGKGFKTKTSLVYHMKKKYSAYDYKCEECSYKTITKVQLERHNVQNHTKAFRFICSECGKGFTERVFLKLHMSRHTDERNYQCSFCENRFRLKETLKSHENIHLNIKPYECNMCPKKFGGHNNLKVHIKRHLNQKDYVCSTCKRGFIEPAGLRNHGCPKK